MNLSESTFIGEFRDNWGVLAAAFMCLLFAFSAPAFALPFIYGPIIDEFGWSREQATLLASSKYAAGAIAAIFVGRFVDVIGVRAGLIILSVLGGIAMLSFLWIPDLTVYYLVGVLLGVSGTGIIVAVKVLVARNFHVSQGTAMSVAMLATSLGATLTPLIITPLIAEHGWRAATAMMSAGTWLVALPLLIFCIRDAQFDAGVTPQRDSAGVTWKLLLELAAQGRFWLIALALFSAAVVDQAFIQHQVLYLEVDLGMTPGVVAAGISSMGLVGIVARLFVGGVFDRLSVRGVSLMYLALAGSALLALLALNPLVFATFIVLRAVGHAAVLLDSAVLSKHVFGFRNLGLLLGVYTSFVAIGFALGPWLVGRLYTISGSYVLPFVICAALAVFAAIILLPVKPEHWLAGRQRGAEKPAFGGQKPGLDRV